MYTVRYNDNGTLQVHPHASRYLGLVKMWAKELSRDFHGTACVTYHTARIEDTACVAVYDRGFQVW